MTISCTALGLGMLLWPGADVVWEHPVDFSDVTFIQPASGIRDEGLLEVLQCRFPFTPLHVLPGMQDVPYHAADDQTRAEQLQKALTGKPHFLWSVQGGYGSSRLFPYLQTMPKPAVPKVLVGYSDITFLHLFFAKWGWKTLHAAMPVDTLRMATFDQKNFQALQEIMIRKKGTLVYSGFQPLNSTAVNSAPIQGSIIGGNLSILVNSIGTSWQVKPDHQILFIEDVGEKGYAVDRYLNHLQQAQIFRKVRAIVFGSFVKSDEYLQFALNRFAQGFAESHHIPVFQTDIFGHGEKNYPLPFGFVSHLQPDPPLTTFTLTIPYDFTPRKK